MKIAVLTQNDIHAIPDNIEKLAQISGVEICSIGVLTGPADIKNKSILFLKAFGLWQCGLIQFFGIFLKFKSLCFTLAHLIGIFGKPVSIRNVCALHEIQFLSQVRPNSNEYISYIKNNEVDLVVSFSAPLIFCDALLNAPRSGCINLHCSLLPEFAGIMPSFWTLYSGAAKVGATVHYMDTKIDNGEIIAQQALNEIPESIYENILQTKKLGGELMKDVVETMSQGGVIECIATNVTPGSYFSWPTLDDLKEFRMRGGRFI